MHKVISLLGVLLLSGCYTDQVWNNKKMVERAEELCKEYSGIYQYGWEGDYGNVICYDDLATFDVFTKERID